MTTTEEIRNLRNFNPVAFAAKILVETRFFEPARTDDVCCSSHPKEFLKSGSFTETLKAEHIEKMFGVTNVKAVWWDGTHSIKVTWTDSLTGLAGLGYVWAHNSNRSQTWA